MLPHGHTPALPPNGNREEKVPRDEEKSPGKPGDGFSLAQTPHRCSPQPDYRGSFETPIRYSSTARAHWRPSRIAQTTRDWPRRMSPHAKMLGTEVR